MLVPTHPNKVPPGGYCRYNDPDTKAYLQHPYFHTLEQMVVKHRVANKLPYDPTDFVQNVCQSTPGMPCHDANDHKARIGEQVRSALSAGAAWLKSGMAMASKDILEARLGKCNGCQYWGGTSGGSLLAGKCGLCGCNGIKLALATTKCPRGLWLITLIPAVHLLYRFFLTIGNAHAIC